MGHIATPLSAERHFMGSSASGRYATDRSARPDYSRTPSPAELARRAALRPAHHARYLHDQDILGLVLACHESKMRIERARRLLAVAQRTLHEIDAVDGSPLSIAQLEQLQRRLRAAVEQSTARRRESSRQLRLIGISPKVQARILAEAQRRREALRKAGGCAESEAEGTREG